MHPNIILAALALALPVHSMVNMGCYSDAGSLKNQGPYSYQSPGYCQDHCLGAGKSVFALTRGNMCYCGDALPTEKVNDDKCNQVCPGWPAESCGGNDTFSVYQIIGENAPDSASDGASTTAAPTAATAAGGIIVAPTTNSAPSGIVTAVSSMNSKGVTALASKSANAATAAATSATVSASPTNNAAGTLQVGSSMMGAVVAGMGLLL
ncbi:uncharacterized protein N7511_004432 [Penicillium nucicola]|uniref:uncharacterized protein n=1 Tax=Penicillium nucicola TaxID=1850975 RepID=UPI00254558BA|nr:uncharacterized protein N7511_004432 [Penicillium nucicola]KAJ5766816.1 hypothetical protein N7511_004432 [Penicillium nucicola]